MEIKTLKVGYLGTNCYIVTDGATDEAAAIDPGGNAEKIIAYLEKEKKVCTAVLLTHGHFDHILAVKALQERGAKVYIHILDAAMLTSGESLARNVGLDMSPIIPDVLTVEGDEIKVGENTFKVLHTAGHTKGSCCFVSGGAIFSGDTIFLEDYGRTDLRGGSMADLVASMRKLFALEGDYQVYPGHDDPTTLEHERKYNPIPR